MKQNADFILWHRKRISMRGKLLIMIACLFLISFSAYSGVQSKRVKINSEKINLTDAIWEVEAQSDCKFVFNQEDLNQYVNLKVKENGTVDKVLRSLLEGKDLVYQKIDKVYVIKKEIIKKKIPKKEVNKKEVIVTGKVTSKEDGLGMPGVTVVAIVNPNSMTGASTNIEGEFSLIIPKDCKKIKFSFIGMTSVTIPYTGQKVFLVSLEEDKKTLDEVIVNGIFTRKASSYTGSTLSVTSEDLKRVGTTNVLRALSNLSPSLILADNLNLGSDPNAMPQIQLGGTSTFPQGARDLNLKGNYGSSPNQPLFILDGFESSVEAIFDMDMDRVRSITILKDAAAKAIYGSKAGNGVIVIETQQLLSNQTRVTYKANLDVELPDLSSYNLTNSLEKIEAERIDGVYEAGASFPKTQIILDQLYNARLKLAKEGLDTDWLSLPLRNAIGQKHSLTVEMSDGALKFMADLSYKDKQGVMKNSFRKTISGRILTSYRYKNLLFKNIMGITKNNSQNSNYGNYSDYAKMNPYWRAENVDGTIPFYSEIGPNDERYTNPYYNTTLGSKDESTYTNFTDNFYIEAKITSNLKLTSRFGVNIKSNDADKFLPSGHTSFASVHGKDAEKRKGTYRINNGKSESFSGDINMNYSKEIGKHSFFTNLGFNSNVREYQELVYYVEGFPSENMNSPMFGRSYALAHARPTGVSSISKELGFLGVFSYSFDDRFMIDLTGRTNASSQFGSNNRWAKFWSAGAGWNIHNESFLKNSKIIKNLKIRASLGSTGNQNFSTNSSISKYNYYLDNRYDGFIGSYLQNLANKDLKWEEKMDYTIGIDTKIQNLTLKVDLYKSDTENLITSITVPFSTGFSSVYENLGKVENKGFEINANYLVWSRGKNFVSLNFSMAANENKIVELSDAMKSYNDRMDSEAAKRDNNDLVHKYEDGRSLNAIWAVHSLGIDPNTGREIYQTKDKKTTYIWNAEDMVVCGNTDPDFRGNFGFNAEYRGIGAGMTFRYKYGGQMYNQTLVNRVENIDINYNVDKRVLTGRWKNPGDNALYKRLGNFSEDREGNGSSSIYVEKTRATSRFVQDQNELDISSINIYYDFQKSVIKKLGLERLKLAVNMNEVAKFSTIKVERGLSYPFARTMSFSLSATF